MKESRMTRKEFEKVRLQIESEQFRGDNLNPIDFGIQRAVFEQQKLKRLIAAASRVDARTARTKAEQWKRQLKRACQSQERFEKLRSEIQKEKLVLQVEPVRSVEVMARPEV